jgi:type II secretory ATPase GspE/PulE/Tfp pilus assembly ATPase PilB-like protein
VWEKSQPEAIIQYILALAAKKGASDVQIEPKEESISVKYRIDGFFFRVDPIPKQFQQGVAQKALRALPARSGEGRAATDEPHHDQTGQRRVRPDRPDSVPPTHGVSADHQAHRPRDLPEGFAQPGLELEDRVRLLEELKGSFGLVLVTAPSSMAPTRRSTR